MIGPSAHAGAGADQPTAAAWARDIRFLVVEDEPLVSMDIIAGSWK